MVYTSPPHRRRGYAAALVTKIGAALTKQGERRMIHDPTLDFALPRGKVNDQRKTLCHIAREAAPEERREYAALAYATLR
ncbi:hypothetical protein AK812_SmicGene34043 [Symbiodinium microadriaticum]|uniref:Uncharacterized protein n=1 Tax=Symbiodinium microadriaticum TaxID=2951 RepID=A0A1Q9CQ37_SYMMI|nr:hypothetical protein AK812_SmicGene34043 [Symbiodinium microadriaticum]